MKTKENINLSILIISCVKLQFDKTCFSIRNILIEFLIKTVKSMIFICIFINYNTSLGICVTISVSESGFR